MAGFDYVDALRKRIEHLDAKVKSLEAQLEKDAQITIKLDMMTRDTIENVRKYAKEEFEYAFERIRHLEHTLFPNLAEDLCELDDKFTQLTDHRGEPREKSRKDDPEA